MGWRSSISAPRPSKHLERPLCRRIAICGRWPGAIVVTLGGGLAVYRQPLMTASGQIMVAAHALTPLFAWVGRGQGISECSW